MGTRIQPTYVRYNVDVINKSGKTLLTYGRQMEGERTAQELLEECRMGLEDLVVDDNIVITVSVQRPSE